MPKLYHASFVPGIKTLNALSPLHGKPGTKVVYLTENLPYSLFFIWDAARNKKSGKHVTCWLKNGIVYYEEQFPGQLRAFYEGVSGYVYATDFCEEAAPMPERESMWFSLRDVPVHEIIFIEDVYAEIMKHASLGQIRIIPFNEVSPEWIRQLYDHMEQDIIANGLLQQPDCPDAVFYRSFFPSVWEKASQHH